MKSVLLGILTGADNLVVSVGYGPLNLPRKRFWALVVSFGFFECAMTYAGSFFGRQLGALEWIGPSLLIATGLLVVGGTWFFRARPDGPPKLLNHPVSVVLLPLALSLDNLSAGGALGASLPLAHTSALSAGAIAAGLSLGGVAIGHLATSRWTLRTEVAGGVWMSLWGLVMLIAG